jgi:hypothetical protein
MNAILNSCLKYLLVSGICLILVPATRLSGQSTVNRPQTSNYKGILYSKETAFEAVLHTNGFLLGVNFGKLLTYYKTPILHISIGELRHPKEVQQSEIYNFGTGNSNRSFIFGKQNNFILVRAGMGKKYYYSEKAAKNGLAVGLRWEVGPTLGLLKPYYLRLRQFADSGVQVNIVDKKYSPEIENLFLDTYAIEGSSGFSKGLGELSVVPGIHFRSGVHFDWGAFDEFVKAAEMGIMIDAFPKKIPIMVSQENQRIFINLYLSLQLGKRK